MSVSAGAAKFPGVQKKGRDFEADFPLTFSGSYSTGGDTLDLRGKGIPGNAVPKQVNITGQGGFIYQYVNGTNLGNGKVQISVATTSGTNIRLQQHGATTIVAGVTGDVVTASVVSSGQAA